MSRALLIILLLCLSSAAQGQDCSRRLELPSEFNHSQKVAHLPDATVPGLYGTDLYVRGSTTGFMAFGRWDGARWVKPGKYPGVFTGEIPYGLDDLCVFDDGTGPAIYTCGSFSRNELGEPVRGVARWTGEKWVQVGGGVSGHCWALCVYDDGRGPALCVGGAIVEAGGRSVSNIARWDGDQWTDVGGGVWSPGVQPIAAMTVFDDGAGPALYVGGMLTQAGGVEALGVAKWDGHQWRPVGPTPGSSPKWVRTMAVHDDGSGSALYVGGLYGHIGDLIFAQGIARWDGKRWSNVGDTVGGIPAAVNSLAVFDDGSGPQLYAGGTLTEWFGQLAGLARWDGAAWHEIRHDGQRVGARTMTVYDNGAGPALWFSGGLGGAEIIGRLRCASAACDTADCDHTGSLDFFDFLCFQNAFAAADPGADCDEDGELAFLDFLCFQNAFAAGCP